MRFAYIDSHGNEVPIPSVDALALRIELGAVGPDTQLYDAQADLWGPAKTHEIFHTLSREGGDEGFVPPPAPVAPPPAAAPPPTPPEPAAEPPAAAEPEPEPEAADGAADLGLTLADPPPPPEPPEEEAETEDDPVGGGLEELALDFEPAAAPAAEPVDDPVVDDPVEVGAAPEQPAGFDFGDLGGELELESPMEAAEPQADLEPVMDFDASVDMGGDDDLMLETPMSQYDPSSPPGWAEESGDDVMDFSTVTAETAAEDDAIVPPAEATPRQRRTPKDRPSTPKFKRRRSLSGPIVLVVILLALAVGGYVGWPIVSARLAERNAPERPAVVMPTIAPELLSQMQTLVAAAIDDVVDDAEAAIGGGDVPSEPDEEWLAGVYLGNASQFPGIEAFWTGMGQFVDRLRSGDSQSYRDALLARVEAAGLTADDAALLVERADSGLVAAAGARTAAYDTMEGVVLSALDLHDFLLDNEERIEYQPASASTVDPILEAVPDSPELRERMEALISGYTDALDAALGSVDRATRDRLVDAMRDRLREVGVQ